MAAVEFERDLVADRMDHGARMESKGEKDSHINKNVVLTFAALAAVLASIGLSLVGPKGGSESPAQIANTYKPGEDPVKIAAGGFLTPPSPFARAIQVGDAPVERWSSQADLDRAIAEDRAATNDRVGVVLRGVPEADLARLKPIVTDASDPARKRHAAVFGAGEQLAFAR